MLHRFLRFFAHLLPLFLCACGTVAFRPLATIDHIDPQNGYRLENTMNEDGRNGDILMILAFSGGGTRAAALGYGVLESISQQKIAGGVLSDEIDLVYGISGGSVLAAYYALHGANTVPDFENRFLRQDFQGSIIDKVLTVANWQRLTSPQFGRGDLLQEEFDRHLLDFHTYGDLIERRKGPFAVITATDMTTGARFDFTQEYFDALCLNLADVPLSRAVAASSAVPFVFTPLTVNNHGGHCGYKLPEILQAALNDKENRRARRFSDRTRQEYADRFASYQDSGSRPFIHLLDGGLSDNLGLRGILDTAEIYSSETLYDRFTRSSGRRIALIHVNAQNRVQSDIDLSADIPGLTDVLQAVTDIPINRNSEETLDTFRRLVDRWNDKRPVNRDGVPVELYFISLNLADVPDEVLRERVLNITTSFALPYAEVADLKKAARQLLKNSKEYQRLLRDIAAEDSGTATPADSTSAPAPAAAEDKAQEPSFSRGKQQNAPPAAAEDKAQEPGIVRILP